MNFKVRYAYLKGTTVIPCTFEEYIDHVKASKSVEKEMRVALTVVNTREGNVKVSTVFLPMNHGWNGEDLWFETMIFGGEHGGWQERCTNYEQAEALHRRAVALVSTRKKTSWFARLMGAE